MNFISDHGSPGSPRRLENLLQVFLIRANNNIARTILHHLFGLQGPENIDFSYSGRLRDIRNGEGLPFVVQDIVDDLLHPPAQVGFLPQVRQGSLRRSHFAFHQRQLVGKRDEELAVAFSLMHGQDQDASQVIVLGRFLNETDTFSFEK